MTRRDITIKWIAYLAALVVVSAFNYCVVSRLPIALPLLLPMAAVAAAVLEGPKFGALFGMAAGLLATATAHKGLFCIPLLALLGWVCGLLAQYVLRRDLVGHALCAVGAVALWELWQVGSRVIRHTAALPVLLRVALPELLWTLVFSFPVYWLFRFCCTHFGRIYHE